jgi:hypothetical protein
VGWRSDRLPTDADQLIDQVRGAGKLAAQDRDRVGATLKSA